MTVGVSSSAIHEANVKLLGSLDKKNELYKLFFDRDLRLVAYGTADLKQYVIKGVEVLWLASLLISKGHFSSISLYERRVKVEEGFLFKRSTMPLAMSGQERFYKDVEAYSKILVGSV